MNMNPDEKTILSVLLLIIFSIPILIGWGLEFVANKILEKIQI